MHDKPEMGPEFSDFSIAPPRSTHRGSRPRASILLGLLAFFSVLTYLAVGSGSPSELRDRPVILTTLATISGPFVGPIARHGQGCCLDAALRLALVSGPVLGLGLAAQVVPLPFRRGQKAVRLVFWTLGWLTWFLSGLVSFGHALF